MLETRYEHAAFRLRLPMEREVVLFVMRYRYLLHMIALAFGLLALSCSSGPTEPTQLDVEEIQYTVLKYQFDHPAFDDPNSHYKAYYIGLAISDSMNLFRSVTDPSPALVKRFSNHIPPVKKYSDGHYVNTGYYDDTTGERGVIFHVAQITWTSTETGQLISGEYFGGLGADRFRFFVRKTERAWVVDSLHWAGSS